ncbi:ZIP family metal transporter [Pseudoglutamicibacter albus]|uniref:ZIP family metal transporter n=1 Tax=Pseudoglutamicibacter albus TaxID=98671 RepID=UPI000C7846C3|nr:ZIP family metal transporter [Pseudoglutamicibacter albus]PKY79953.1 hypothetical protein CYJ35_06900 [Pseudoglutamicibacter albus]WIK83983.1 ZIP family metal transporter [Pseudoglutamicibacter albus]
MLTATMWGTIAASSLIIGAVLGLITPWPPRLIGAILAFGAGAIFSTIAFELAEESITSGGPLATAIGVALGALTYFIADRLIEGRETPSGAVSGASAAGTASGASEASTAQHSSRTKRRTRRNNAGMVLVMGAILDGIPEQTVLGVGMGAGNDVSIALLIAICLANIPESVGSASDMKSAGVPTRRILGIWLLVPALCALATVIGYGLSHTLSPEAQAGINGFAGGALLVMLVDSMIPEARAKTGRTAGLLTVLGFALGAGLSLLT